MARGKLIKNYIYNTLYQILILIAPLITTPYVSRVLGVTNIGIYNYAQSVATYFVLIGAVGTTLYGQREVAYLQEKPRERSIAFWEIELFRIICVLVCTIIFTLLFWSNGDYYMVYRLMILEIIATAFDISWLFMGMENFKVTVIRNTLIKILGIVGVFLLVKTKDDLNIYTLCISISILIGHLSLWVSIRKYLVKCNVTFREILEGIAHRVKPILVLFLPQIAMDVYMVLDKTMLGLLATNIDEVGYYSQAQKIVKLVLSIITSLGVVMLPSMAALFAKGDNDGIKKSITIAFRFIYMLSFAILFGLCAIAPVFVPIYFGKGYDPVSFLIILISPILILIATSNVIGKQYLLPTSQQKAFTISIICGACINFVLNLVLIRLWNAVGASIATVIAELAVTVVQCFYVRKQLPIKECLTSGIRYAIYGAIMFVAVRGIWMLVHSSNIVVLVIMIFTGAIVYGAELLITKDPMVKMAIGLVKKKKA